MKCPECNGEGGRIPHPENYGRYREDCVRCNGTGKQSPVDKIQRYDLDEGMGDYPLDYGDWCKSEDVTALESELSAARGERDSICELYDLTCEKYEKLQAENERLTTERDALHTCTVKERDKLKVMVDAIKEVANHKPVYWWYEVQKILEGQGE